MDGSFRVVQELTCIPCIPDRRLPPGKEFLQRKLLVDVNLWLGELFGEWRFV